MEGKGKPMNSVIKGASYVLVHTPDMVLLDLGLGGSTTIGVDICSSLRKNHPEIKVLIFTGEVLNEKLW